MINNLILYFIVEFKLFIQGYFPTLKDKNILIIQLSGIGDSILSIPLLKNLKSENNIFVITKNENSVIFKNLVNDNNLFIYNDKTQKLKYLNNLINTYNIDIILSLRSNLPFFIASLFSNVKLIPNPLFERLRIIERLMSFISKKYKNNVYKKTHTANLFNNLIKVNNFIEIDKIYSEELPDDINKFLNENPKICILHFAGQDQIRHLKLDVIQDICSNNYFKIILIGSKKDKLLIKDLKPNHNYINIVGDLTLNQITTLLHKVENIICVDSSIMHLASTNNNLNMICIMGNSLVEYYGPLRYNFSNNITILSRNPYCSPCSKKYCNKFNGYSCIQDISSFEIINALKNLNKIEI
jgi:ADP-heptose:LPS heptosyltransferase